MPKVQRWNVEANDDFLLFFDLHRSEFADHLGVAQDKVAYYQEADEIVVSDEVDPSLCSLLEPEE